MSRARRLPRSVNQSPPCLSNTKSFGPFSGCSPHLSTTVSTLPVDMSTRWIEPPIYSAGDGGPGIRKPRPGIQLKPPLLQTYILPSGPIAAPLGPPGISATTSLRPSGQTRVSRRPRISTSTTDPSGITTGPSGNSRSVASTRTSDMKSSRLSWAPADFKLIPHAQQFRCAMLWQRRHRLPSNQGACAYAKQSRGLLLHRYPDFEAAIASERIELLVVAFEEGRIGRFQSGSRQPLIPDRVDGAANGRDVVAVVEHRISLFGDPNAAEFARQVGKIRYFDAGDVIEVAGIVAVAADAVSHLPDPAGNVRHGLVKALPLAGNAGAALASVALANAGDEKCLAGLETRGLKIVDNG